ncbi:hypothetical protein RRF57_008284 [Xylaria bambusicola]|uniref:Uncharacterized protein n=1 Tax=Xylaria bambusicola TaxID=326684 RepID=A0AAN7Z0J9_9PEZI
MLRALGGHAFSFGSLDDAEETTMDFPRRAAEIFAQAAGPHLPPNRPFTFVFVSIRSAEWDDSKPLLYLKNTRRLKGRAEVELLRTEEASPENLEIKIARPGFLVTGIKSGLKGPLKAIGRRLPGGMVDVERLSHCLLRIALGDFPDHAIFEAEFLNEHGKQDYGQRPNAFIRLGRNIRDRIMRHHHQ